MRSGNHRQMLAQLEYQQSMRARVVEPHVVEPQVVEPHVLEPQVVEPHVLEPQVLEPHVLEPQVRMPHVVWPHVFGDEILSTSGGPPGYLDQDGKSLLRGLDQDSRDGTESVGRLQGQFKT